MKKPADELGSIAKDTSEDIMIDVKDAAGKAGETVNEGMSEAKPVVDDTKEMLKMAKKDAKEAKEAKKEIKDTMTDSSTNH